MIVDGHLHLFKAVSERYPRDVHEEMMPADREESVEKFIRAMADAGVDRAIVVPTSPHDEYLKEVLKSNRGTFAGLGLFDPESDDPKGDLLSRVEDIGIQGLRVYSLYGSPDQPIETLRLFPMLEAMSDLGLKLWFYSSQDQLELLDRVLDALPELTVVLNHMGFCPDESMPLSIDADRRPRFGNVKLPPRSLELVTQMARHHPSLHVHLSGQYAFSKRAYPYSDLAPTAQELLNSFGPERILWASDWPWIQISPGYNETLGLVDEQLPDLSSADRSKILGDNAARLFDF